MPTYLRLTEPQWMIPSINRMLEGNRLLIIAWFVVFNATFNNISVISWRSVLLVEETRVPRENHRPAASH
jgi:hypothetical protein